MTNPYPVSSIDINGRVSAFNFLVANFNYILEGIIVPYPLLDPACSNVDDWAFRFNGIITAINNAYTQFAPGLLVPMPLYSHVDFNNFTSVWNSVMFFMYNAVPGGLEKFKELKELEL